MRHIPFAVQCYLVEVELGDLKKVSKDIAEVVNRKLGTEVQVKGKILFIPDTVNGKHYGVKDVKLIMKHALHQLGMANEYRVLAEHHQVRIVKVEEKTHYAERAGAAPPPSQSLPYFFPG
jgi:hypothetical protein